MSSFFTKIRSFNLRKWRFLIASGIFLIFMAFIDENNFVTRIKYQREINFLKTERTIYQKRIKRDSIKIEQLRHNIRTIERTAREKYGMKAPDEDVFIITEDNGNE
ncbi:MAG: septum formation initiator family protein [Bacteroidales bacterium]